MTVVYFLAKKRIIFCLNGITRKIVFNSKFKSHGLNVIYILKQKKDTRYNIQDYWKSHLDNIRCKVDRYFRYVYKILPSYGDMCII